MTDIAADMVQGWQGRSARGEAFDVAAEMMRLTLRVVGRTLMGVNLGDDTDLIGPAITELMCISSLVSLPPSIPTPRNLRFRKALGTLNRIIYDIIARRRREAPGSTTT